MKQRRVYFVRSVNADGPIKIGCSVRPDRRLFNLTIWSPVDLEVIHSIPGDLALERRFHDHFAAEFQRQEWFEASPRLLSAIEALKVGATVDEVLGEPVRRNWRASRKNLSPERREYLSAASRVRGLERRMRGRNVICWRVPDDVRTVLNNWRDGQYPTEDQKARIDQLVANPWIDMQVAA